MDKIDRLLDAIEHPDRYSEKDIETMLADPEIREIYNLLDKTSASITPITSPDVSAEWETFKNSHPATRQRRTFKTIFTRNIAASIAIGIASLATVAAVVGASINYVLDKKTEESSTETVAEVKERIVPNDSTIASEATISETAPGTIVFDNEPFETILGRIAGYYGYTVAFSEDSPKTLRLYFRWNQAQTLDEVVESLNNFEQIHISITDKTIKID